MRENKLVSRFSPVSDCYRITSDQLISLGKEVIAEDTGQYFDIDLNIDQETKFVTFMIRGNIFLSTEKLDLLSQKGYNVYVQYKFHKTLLANINGGDSNVVAKYLYRDQQGNDWISIYTKSKLDMIPMIHKAIETALYSSREETVQYLNIILKYCKNEL